MKSKILDQKLIREKLEERVKFFLGKNISKIISNPFQKKNIINNSHTPTLKDSLTKTENEKVTKEKKNNKK